MILKCTFYSAAAGIGRLQRAVTGRKQNVQQTIVNSPKEDKIYAENWKSEIAAR